MSYVHEVIDHGRGQSPDGSLCHVLFSTEWQARAYISRLASAERRSQCQYLARNWSEDAMSRLWVDDRRDWVSDLVDYRAIVLPSQQGGLWGIYGYARWPSYSVWLVPESLPENLQ